MSDTASVLLSLLVGLIAFAVVSGLSRNTKSPMWILACVYLLGFLCGAVSLGMFLVFGQ